MKSFSLHYTNLPAFRCWCIIEYIKKVLNLASQILFITSVIQIKLLVHKNLYLTIIIITEPVVIRTIYSFLCFFLQYLQRFERTLIKGFQGTVFDILWFLNRSLLGECVLCLVFLLGSLCLVYKHMITHLLYERLINRDANVSFVNKAIITI